MAQYPESIKKIDFSNIKIEFLIDQSKDNLLSVKIICNFSETKPKILNIKELPVLRIKSINRKILNRRCTKRQNNQPIHISKDTQPSLK